MTAQNNPTQKINKMHIATCIMRKLLAERLPTETDTDINRKFKNTVMTHPQLKMTKSGANTYCSNVRTFLAGGDPYRHNKAANEKRNQLQQVAKELNIPYVDTSIGRLRVLPEANTEDRWWVVNPVSSELVETHGTRSKAIDVAKALSLKMVDKKIVVTAA